MSPWILAAWIGCQAFDAGSTYAAISSGRFREGNAAMSHRALYPLKVSLNVGAFLAYRHTRTKTKAAAIIPAIMIASGCAAGTWNTYQMHRSR